MGPGRIDYQRDAVEHLFMGHQFSPFDHIILYHGDQRHETTESGRSYLDVGPEDREQAWIAVCFHCRVHVFLSLFRTATAGSAGRPCVHRVYERCVVQLKPIDWSLLQDSVGEDGKYCYEGECKL